MPQSWHRFYFCLSILYTDNMWWRSLAPGLAYKSELREAEAAATPISVWSPAHLHLAWVCRASSSSCHHFTCKDSSFELKSVECNTEQCSLLTGEWPKRPLLRSSGFMWDSELSPQVAWPTWLWPPANTVPHPTQRVFLLAAEQTGLDSADLLPSGLKETEGWSNKIHYIYHFVSPYHELLRKGTKRITTEKSTVIVAPEHHMEKIAKATNHSTTRAEVVELRWGCYKPLLCIII